MEIKEDCPICQVSPGNGMSSCGHFFHVHCLYEWLNRNHTCPICRKIVFADLNIICLKCGMYSLKKQLKNVIKM